jgi:hypothetical protein
MSAMRIMNRNVRISLQVRDFMSVFPTLKFVRKSDERVRSFSKQLEESFIQSPRKFVDFTVNQNGRKALPFCRCKKEVRNCCAQPDRFSGEGSSCQQQATAPHL